MRSKRYFGFLTLLLYLMLAACLFLTACEQAVINNEPSSVSQGTSGDSEKRPDPWDTVSKVVDCIQRDDTRALMPYIYPAAIDRYGEAQIVERNAKIHADLGVSSISYTNMAPLDASESGRQVFYTAHAAYKTRYGLYEKDVTLSFIWHPNAGAWQLEWTPAVILPGLNENGSVKIEHLPAKRGRIYDRSGYPLALEDTIAGVSLVPGQFHQDRISEVNELLHLEPGTIERKLAQSWVRDDTLVPITVLPSLRDVDYKIFRDLGLQWEEQVSRTYPFGEACAQLIGYVGRVSAEDLEKPENEGLTADDFIGKTGLELIYDKRLRGEHGFRIYLSGQYEQTLLEKRPVDGEDLYLTIDALAQRAIYEDVKAYEMTVSAIDPKSGEIIALVSTPSYNPLNFVLGISQSEYERLMSDPGLPLNAKFASRFTPGSTQKLLSAVIALNSGWDPERRLDIQGKTWQANEGWGNYYVTRYRELNQAFDLEDAITASDNIFFARMICELGSKVFNLGMKELGIGAPVSPDYPFAPSQICNAGEIAPDQEVLLADSAYGQGELLMSPIELASIYGALVNEGKMPAVRLLLNDKVNGNPPAKKITEPQNAELLCRAMERVADEQYPRQLLRESFKLAGKSGTAEVGPGEDGEMRINSWFVGYDREHPSICAALTLFDSQKYKVTLSLKRFGDLFDNLYRRGPYEVPPAKMGEMKSERDIPVYIPCTHEPDEDPEGTSEQTEANGDEQP